MATHADTKTIDGDRATPIRFTTYLLKVASRCNIACDYCYMYEHNDQSWRDQPHVMSSETRQRVIERLVEYVTAAEIGHILVIFHGGEPLLARPAMLASFANHIRAALPAIQVDFSIQTNGVLLDESCLDALEAAEIGVSLSLDGPAELNDLHRRSARGDSTFSKAMAALDRLRRRPSLFTGVISVIDPVFPPDHLFEFFADLNVPALDLLLPDANYTRLPPGRVAQPNLYVDWLLRAFDLWYDRYPTMRLRTFDSLLSALAGLPGGTDAFGLGDISLLSIETDGSYHDLDVLKITAAGQTSLGGTVHTAAISDVVSSPELKERRQLLSMAGLADACHSCQVVDVCGGGSVPHRYSAEGFRNPTVYCREMLALVRHARNRLQSTLSIEQDLRNQRGRRNVADLRSFETSQGATAQIQQFLGEWRQSARGELRSLVDRIASDPSMTDAVRHSARVTLDTPDSIIDPVATRPSVVLWTRVGRTYGSIAGVRDLTGQPVAFDPSYVLTIERMLSESGERDPHLHRNDPWLRLPFTNPIEFVDASEARSGQRLVRKALALILDYSPHLAHEIQLLSPEIQFIRDLSAHPDKVVSFSDDVVPGALYLGLGSKSDTVDVYDVAESLIHEHRHQKLYLLGRHVELVANDRPFIISPWREEPRPPSGLLHATWVFVELRRFWRHLECTANSDVQHRAQVLVRTTDRRLTQAWITLSHVDLTPAGQQLVGILQERSRP